jgi:hypothetical protein
MNFLCHSMGRFCQCFYLEEGNTPKRRHPSSGEAFAYIHEHPQIAGDILVSVMVELKFLKISVLNSHEEAPCASLRGHGKRRNDG